MKWILTITQEDLPLDVVAQQAGTERCELTLQSHPLNLNVHEEELSSEEFNLHIGQIAKGDKGDKGDNAPLLKTQYSADGLGNWHDSPQSTDYYIRFSNDNGVTWGGAALFRGSDATDKTYVYEQGVSASVWNITHNLGKFPSVTIVDSSGEEVMGEVQHINNNSCKITFSAAFKGKAYLN